MDSCARGCRERSCHRRWHTAAVRCSGLPFRTWPRYGSPAVRVVTLYDAYSIPQQPAFSRIEFHSGFVCPPRDEKIVRDRNQPDNMVLGLVPLLHLELKGALWGRESSGREKSLISWCS